MCLRDPYGRIINYLRVSITDRCNLSCVYCRPKNSPFFDERDLLTSEEILAFCREAALLGIRHIRITGGEPLLRNCCCAIIKSLKELPGIDTVTMTTNGILLKRYLIQLKEAGIDGINISMDTPDRKRYALLTGFDRLPQLMEAIRETTALEIPVKINSVLMDSQLPVTDYLALAELAHTMPVDIRFIEAMPLGKSPVLALNHKKLLALLNSRYPGMEPFSARRGYGPAAYYHIPGFCGCIGFISAVHGSFCESCNRIRLTARGILKSCLGCEGTLCIKPLFREADYKNSLQKAILDAVGQKPPFHHFGETLSHSEQENMSKIGG